jgi:UDP-N-acetylglucosamine--N-acetylmuramyl-(pentapeptide) pyrophosphoryl-undecaprenol N-acetylglucosamine transferase
VVDAVSSEANGHVEFLYLGGTGSAEETLAARFRIPFQAIQAGSLRGVKPWTGFWNGLKLMVGLAQAYFAIKEFRPDALLVSGGYMSVPVVLAGYLRRIPVLIYLPDIVPGLAVLRLSRWASRVAVSFEETASFFEKRKVVVTGYPVRREFFGVDKAQARTQLRLEPDSPVVMVFGGSRGAHSINVAVARILPDLLAESQVIHVCGPNDAAEAEANREELPPKLRERYRSHAYLHEEMPQALAAADLVVARAGASTLGEFPALGLPSILVPYPYSGQHQDANAEYMASHGAAIKMRDADLQQELLPAITELLKDRERLSEMRRQAQALSRPKAAYRVAAELRSLASVSL